VVLDSVESSGVELISQWDQQFDAVGRKLMDLCAQDEHCRLKLGLDPWQSLQNLYAKLETGFCPGAAIPSPTRENLRWILGNLLDNVHGRVFALALIYRLNRCDAADLTAWGGIRNHFFKWYVTPSPFEKACDELFSSVLHWHINFSEVWELPAPTFKELEARIAPLSFSLDSALENPLYDEWPRYPHDDFVWGWPKTSVPVLMMNGTLDPRTPIEKAKAAADHLQGPNQTFVSFPQTPHWALNSSPVTTPGAPSCGHQVITSFLANPKAPPDTSCLADLLPIKFTYDAAFVREIMGTDDLWEN
jgi:pimeloyl-ACP methyl ester carboxylesterase